MDKQVNKRYFVITLYHTLVNRRIIQTRKETKAVVNAFCGKCGGFISNAKSQHKTICDDCSTNYWYLNKLGCRNTLSPRMRRDEDGNPDFEVEYRIIKRAKRRIEQWRKKPLDIKEFTKTNEHFQNVAIF